jgi:transcriptional regulator with XRE-family HTH domain
MNTFSTPREVAVAIADRVRQQRLLQNWTQEELADRAGISVATYRRFEQNGTISLERLLLIASALHLMAEFDQLFALDAYPSLDAIEATDERTQRKGRARKETQR